MYDDNDTSTGAPEKYTKEQAQKMERERNAEEARQNVMRDEEKAQDKARTRAVENDYFKDNRTKSSPLIVNAEIAKMKETLNMPKSGGGGGGGIPKVGPKKPLDMKKGGKVSSASSRADGIAQRGKTRGRIV